MSFAVVVLAHKSPEQVNRLASALAPNRVFLHVDSGTDAVTWANFQSLLGRAPNVTLMPRRRTAWASWALVEAAFDGIEAALSTGSESHILLLSGQDYPLTSANEIARFLDDNRDVSFVPHWKLPSKIWGTRGGMDRVRDYNFRLFGKRVRVRGRRRVPNGLVLAGGSMYWVLNRDAAERLLALRQTQPGWIRFLSRCWIPDELAIPSLLVSATPSLQILSENLSYIRWSSPGSAHPDTLTFADRHELAAAAAGPSAVGGQARFKLFARKFDWKAEPMLGDWIDTNLVGFAESVDDR